MNVLPAELRGDRAVVGGGHEIRLDRSYPDLTARSVEVGIRPDFVRISTDAAGVTVKVQRVDDIGRIKVARVRLDGLRLNALASSDARIAGDEARLIFDPAHIHVYADGHRVEPTQAGQGMR